MKILFLCTGNSCRSQMAEGWMRHYSPAYFQVASAGIEAHGKNPNAVRVMKEAGVDISMHESKVVTESMINDAEHIITVCGHADEYCPPIPVGIAKSHWPLEDPAKATGSDEYVADVFRETRDNIESLVKAFLSSVNNERKTFESA